MSRKKPKGLTLAKKGRASLDNWWEVTVRFEFIAPLSAEDAASSMRGAIEQMAETAFLDDRIAAVGLLLPQGYLVKERPVRPTLKAVRDE